MSGTRRIVVLGICLLALLIGINTLFGGRSPVWAAVGAASPSPWFEVIRQWAAPALIGLIMVPLFWMIIGSNRLLLQGAALIEQDRCSEALAKFEAARRRNPISALGPYNMGLTLMLLWRLGPSEEALFEAEKRSFRGDFVSNSVPFLRALVAALAGRTEAAQAMLDRLDPKAPDTGTAQLTRAILAARRGAFDQALTLVEGLEVRRLGGVKGALGGALRAWALAELGGELRHVDRVALFGETGPEVVRAAWPELVAFVDRAPAG